MDSEKNDLQEKLRERFENLPEVVRIAITSADVQKEMRTLAEKHKLHVDQWGALENEVQLALLGFQSVQDLPKNISSEVGIPAEAAAALAVDINTIVFEPIRQQLERQLEHPDAVAEKISDAEAVRQGMLSASTPTVIPATPPADSPTEKSIRAPISASYTASTPSTERKAVAGDPYREPPK